MLKILVVYQHYYPEPFRITDICETLVKEGHEVTVLTGLPNYPEGRILDEYRYGKKRKEVINGVTVIRCFILERGNSRWQLFFNYISFAISASLKALYIKNKFDVIFAHQTSPVMMAIPAIVYKRRHRIRMLLYCLDLWPDSLAAGGIREGSFVYRVFLKISRWVYSQADTILVSSKTFKGYFEHVLKMNTRHIKHLPQYAEDIFTEQVFEPENNKCNIVFAGNIGEMQSVETIIRAADKLREYVDIVFHLVGSGSRLDECKKLTASLELKNVVFHGRLPVEEMPKIYSMASALLITLKNSKVLNYTIPGKLQSYMAARKPIIGSINGETREIIEESGCGLCCAAEDYEGLANIILKFHMSNDREQMAARSQDYYLNNYSKSRFIKGLETALLDLGVD